MALACGDCNSKCLLPFFSLKHFILSFFLYGFGEQLEYVYACVYFRGKDRQRDGKMQRQKENKHVKLPWKSKGYKKRWARYLWMKSPRLFPRHCLLPYILQIWMKTNQTKINHHTKILGSCEFAQDTTMFLLVDFSQSLCKELQGHRHNHFSIQYVSYIDQKICELKNNFFAHAYIFLNSIRCSKYLMYFK